MFYANGSPQNTLVSGVVELAEREKVTLMGDDKLKVNLDIDVPNLPCSLISIDIEDAMGAIP